MKTILRSSNERYQIEKVWAWFKKKNFFLENNPVPLKPDILISEPVFFEFCGPKWSLGLSLDHRLYENDHNIKQRKISNRKGEGLI